MNKFVKFGISVVLISAFCFSSTISSIALEPQSVIAGTTVHGTGNYNNYNTVMDSSEIYVKTESQLRQAIEFNSEKTIVLANSINFNSQLLIEKPINLHLNNFVLTCGGIKVCCDSQTNINIYNGIIQGAELPYGEDADCALDLIRGKTYLKNVYVYGADGGAAKWNGCKGAIALLIRANSTAFLENSYFYGGNGTFGKWFDGKGGKGLVREKTKHKKERPYVATNYDGKLEVKYSNVETDRIDETTIINYGNGGFFFDGQDGVKKNV